MAIYDFSYAKNCNLVQHRIIKQHIHFYPEPPEVKTPAMYIRRLNGKYYDNRYFDDDGEYSICYDTWYTNTHFKCPDEKFKVINVFLGPRVNIDNNPNKRAPMVAVYCSSGAVHHIFLKQFNMKKFFDPYYRTMFNGMCGIGNIGWDSSLEEDRFITECYKSWYEIMGRCYNMNHPLFDCFGGIGVVCAQPKWHIFEFFMQDNLNMVKLGLIPMLDYNDHSLYLPIGPLGHSDEMKRLFSRLPYRVDYVPSIILPARIRDITFDEREYKMLKRPGRPATGRKRKKRMYKLLPEE